MITILKHDFKTIQLAAYLTGRDEVSSRVYRFLLPKLLTSHTDHLASKTLMSEKLEDLYGAYFKSRVERIGDVSVMSIMLTIVDPKIIADKALLKTAVQLFKDALFDHTLFKNDVFFEEKRMFIEQWQTIKDKKRLYAQHRFQALMYEKDPYGVPLSGTVKDIKPLTSEDFDAYYQQVLRDDHLTYVVNGQLTAEEESLIRGWLEADESKDLPEPVMSFRQARRKPVEKIESIDMKQAILRLGYHFPVFRVDEDYAAALVLDAVLGGYPDSRLFQDIREKQGLCYDVFSSYEPYKGVMTIGAGVDAKADRKALDAIKKLVETLKTEGVTNEELTHAKQYIAHQLKTSLDNQSVLTKRTFLGMLFKDKQTIEERLALVHAVTKSDVDRLLGQLALDTVYVLKGGDDA
ncbi:MAG: insulinase family protein [Acholeplasmataceae bacterium]|nr:MAG: insulinase family protein [Acholeplasmataceae bacterium]